MKGLTVEAFIKTLACVGMIIIMAVVVYGSMKPARDVPDFDFVEQLEKKQREN